MDAGANALFVLTQLMKYNKPINFVYGIWKNEWQNIHKCKKWKIRFKNAKTNVKIICFELKIDLPRGYGFSKIVLIDRLPYDDIIFIDCDAFPVADVTQL